MLSAFQIFPDHFIIFVAGEGAIRFPDLEFHQPLVHALFKNPNDVYF